MNNLLANFSTDLLRVSYWIYYQNDSLVVRFLVFCRKTYSTLNPKIGCFPNIWEEIDKISDFKNNRLQAAERALTLSRIMLIYSQKNE